MCPISKLCRRAARQLRCLRYLECGSTPPAFPPPHGGGGRALARRSCARTSPEMFMGVSGADRAQVDPSIRFSLPQSYKDASKNERPEECSPVQGVHHCPPLNRGQPSCFVLLERPHLIDHVDNRSTGEKH